MSDPNCCHVCASANASWEVNKVCIVGTLFVLKCRIARKYVVKLG